MIYPQITMGRVSLSSLDKKILMEGGAISDGHGGVLEKTISH